MSTLAIQIREAAFARIIKVMTFKSTRKIPFPTLQPDKVPGLGVFLLREMDNADGDANVGPPRYVTDAIIAIAVADLASKPAVLDGSVDAAVDLIKNTLLCDSTFLDLRDAENNKPIIESIPTITRTTRFPQEGETYYCEVSLQMTFRFRCFFEPVAPNALTTITVNPTALYDTNSVPVAQFNF